MYEQFFQLSESPFRLNPDPRFYYASPEHQRAQAYLEYGLQQGEGFIVLSGEIGTGKTTLMQGLLQRLPAMQMEAATLVSTQLDATEILRAIGFACGLAVAEQEASALLHLLETHWRKLRQGGKRVVLLVDEAQNLTVAALESLRMLSNFQYEQSALLQILLLGQPELRQTLQRPDMEQLRQRIVVAFHLNALNLQETSAYIEYRLQCSGWGHSPPFSQSVLAEIFRISGGVPRKINRLCDRALLAAYLEGQYSVSMAQLRILAEEWQAELAPPEEVRAEIDAGIPAVTMTKASFGLLERQLQQLSRHLAKIEQWLRVIAASQMRAHPPEEKSDE